MQRGKALPFIEMYTWVHLGGICGQLCVVFEIIWVIRNVELGYLYLCVTQTTVGYTGIPQSV